MENGFCFEISPLSWVSRQNAHAILSVITLLGNITSDFISCKILSLFALFGSLAFAHHTRHIIHMIPPKNIVHLWKFNALALWSKELFGVTKFAQAMNCLLLIFLNIFLSFFGITSCLLRRKPPFAQSCRAQTNNPKQCGFCGWHTRARARSCEKWMVFDMRRQRAQIYYEREKK